MLTLTSEFIKKDIADSEIIFQRGQKLYEYGGFYCMDEDFENGLFAYDKELEMIIKWF